MSDTLSSLRRALDAESIIAVAPIVVMTRSVGIAWALLAPGRRPLIEVRWFTDQRRGILAPQIARLERLAGEAARDTDLSIRIETTDERRAYEELAPQLADRLSFGDDLARRRSALAVRGLAFGIPLDLRMALDLQDAAELLIGAGLLRASGASLATLNGALTRPVGREAFDSAVGRLAASIRVWHEQIAPAALVLLQNAAPIESGVE